MPRAFERVAQGIDQVIILVLQDRDHLVDLGINLVGIVRQFLGGARTLRVHHNVEGLEKLDTVID